MADKEKLPQYSVLMSVYAKDNADYLELAIDSMLQQTVLPEQYVIVKDGLVTEEIENILDDIIFLQYGNIRMYAPVDEIRDREGKSIDALFREVFRC